MLAVAHPWASTTSYLSSQFLTNSRRATFMPPRGRPTLVLSFSLLLFHPLTHLSPRPRSETPLEHTSSDGKTLAANSSHTSPRVRQKKTLRNPL